MLPSYKLTYYKERFDEIIGVFLDEIRDYVKYDICGLTYINDDISYATVLFSSYADEENSSKFQNKIVDLTKKTRSNLLRVMVEKKQAIIFSYPDGRNCEADQYEPFFEDIKSEVYIPFLNGSATAPIGCLYLGSYDPENVFKRKNLTDLEFLSKLMRIQGGFSIIYDKYREERYLGKLIHILDDVIRQRDKFMVNHHYNVAHWASIIADELGFSEDKKHKLYIAAVLHDIGKLYISESILGKNGKLSDEEYGVIKKHPEYSHTIVNALLQNDIAEIVRYHHERYDGKGYPEGLKGESIPLESRILTVSDAVDSMLSYRSYKERMKINTVIKEITKNRSKQFDPKIADIAVKILMSIKRVNTEILSNPIILGTINIITETETFTLQGTIIHSENGYIFQTYKSYSMKKIKQNEITAICFFTEAAESIHEYEVKLRSIKGERVYISDLLPVFSTEYFNMIWDLKGVLSLDSDDKLDVDISKISGNSLMFAVEKGEFDITADNKTYSFDIYFENSSIISVTGKITKRYEVCCKVCCVFKYVNITDRTRDIIIRHIFRKQGELRRGTVS